jgi:transcriptional regulator with XRE-family HTH domain
MGRSRRKKPERLAAKLHAIRKGLELTQEQMIERLNGKEMRLYPASISEYEKGKREPPLLVLLAYARAAGVPMEFLVDDEQDLPEHLPLKPGHKWRMKHGRLVQE